MRRPHKRPRCGDTVQAGVGFADALLSQLSTLREDDVCCDVTLVCSDDGTRVRAHRVVLAAQSPWFEALVRRWSDGEHASETVIDEVSGVGLEAVVQFVYSGALEVTADNCAAMLHASKRLQVDAMTQAARGRVRSAASLTRGVATGAGDVDPAAPERRERGHGVRDGG